ncbi:MAG: site-2 protease family protein [Candidatus Thermoplasmatota archaeon]|nr:site-2 protease family protein [Candidatus Thermoplasmatota archaeon]
MTIIEIISFLAFIVGLYGILSIYLKRKGYFEKYNISFYGPALMFRTKKGLGFLKRISNHKRFWMGFGKTGVIICFIMMMLMVSLIILNTWAVLEFTPEEQQALPGIEFGLILPGINPLLPLDYLFYIIIALIIGIIVHEFSHGILTFAHGLKVKSLGLLYLIVPLGAFCEPDEEELRATSVKKRMQVYAAGPMSNFIVAFIALLLFSYVGMAAVQPMDGVHVSYVIQDSPAELIGLSAGMVIHSLNNTTVTSPSDFQRVMESVSVNQQIPIEYSKDHSLVKTTITTTSRSEFSGNQSHKNMSFVGIGFNTYIHGFIRSLQQPLTNIDGLLLLYSLPLIGYFVGYNPLVSPFTQGLEVTGLASMLPSSVFWIALNLVFWIFWLNLLLGFFNVLPMVPLDGGYIFYDSIRFFVKRVKKNLTEERVERVVRKITLFISLCILFLVLFPWLVKYF